MSNVIQVLEKMGSDATLQNNDAIQTLLASTELETEMTQAIASEDVTSLAHQLDVCLYLVCGVFPAEDDDESEEKEDEDDSTEETNSRVIGF